MCRRLGGARCAVGGARVPNSSLSLRFYASVDATRIRWLSHTLRTSEEKNRTILHVAAYVMDIKFFILVNCVNKFFIFIKYSVCVCARVSLETNLSAKANLFHDFRHLPEKWDSNDKKLEYLETRVIEGHASTDTKFIEKNIYVSHSDSHSDSNYSTTTRLPCYKSLSIEPLVQVTVLTIANESSAAGIWTLIHDVVQNNLAGSPIIHQVSKFRRFNFFIFQYALVKKKSNNFRPNMRPF